MQYLRVQVFILFIFYLYLQFLHQFIHCSRLHRECINLRDISVSGELLVSWKRMTWSKSREGSKLAI